MALTKISRSLLDTGISDSSDATAITIDSSENVTIGTVGSGASTATPVELNLGSTFADSAGSKSKMKLKLFEDTSSNILGFGISNSALEYHSNGVHTFYKDESEKMRLDSSGNLGIGIASPDGVLHIHKASAGSVTAYSDSNLIIETDQSNNFLTMLSPAGANQGILFGDADANWRGQIQYNHATDAMQIYAAAGVELRIDSDGLKFGSDTAAANALDDYEEGTFTPLFYGSTSGTANNDSSGYYTKIGRQVTIHVDVYNKAFGTYSGDLRMQLPFTNAGTSIPSSAGDIYFYPSGNWDGVSNFAGIGVRCYSTSYLNFALIQLDSDRQTYIGSSNTSTSNSSGNFLRFSFTYVAA